MRSAGVLRIQDPVARGGKGGLVWVGCLQLTINSSGNIPVIFPIFFTESPQSLGFLMVGRFTWGCDPASVIRWSDYTLHRQWLPLQSSHKPSGNMSFFSGVFAGDDSIAQSADSSYYMKFLQHFCTCFWRLIYISNTSKCIEYPCNFFYIEYTMQNVPHFFE